VHRIPVSKLAAALAFAPFVAGQLPRPEVVVVIVSDDQGWADIGYNNSAVWSPNLDRLAASGARLEQAYSMPQCTPTRVALLTGRYPSRFGRVARQANNARAVPHGTATLATLFRAAGYHTALTGKWHLGSRPEDGPNHFGFASSYGSLGGAVGMYDHRYRSGRFEFTWHRNCELIEGSENGTHATDLVAAEAVRVIEQNVDRPLFLYVPFHSVHTPLDERGRFVDQPTQLDPDRPGRWRNEDEIEWFHDPDGRIQREADPERRLLLAAVNHLDSAVGSIVDALDRTGRREQTLLIFTSDNGPQGSWPGNAYPDDLKLTDFNQPVPMRGKKVDVYEGGIHVPAFVNWPGVIQPMTVDTPVHVVDWMPTLATALGQEIPEDPQLDGMDLGPTFELDHAQRGRELYWTWGSNPNRWALRVGRYKLVRYGKSSPQEASDWQLFDLLDDPMEKVDLASQQPEILADLHQRYLRLQASDRL
jgi:arylsulfatase A-like enzyme